MLVLLHYFWFYCAALWLVIIILKRKDLRILVSAGKITETEMLIFQIRSGATIVIPCSLLGIIQTLGNFPSPLHLTAGSLSNPWVLMAWVTIGASCLLLLYWLWLRNGAEYLAVFAPAFGLPENPTIIRYGLSFVVFVCVMSSLLQAFGKAL